VSANGTHLADQSWLPDLSKIPHDITAEQCTLGGMMLSQDAIADVMEVLRPDDHYRPAHQVIHEAILDLYARGEPTDIVSVGNELGRRGDLVRVGAGPYLHTCISSVPSAANAGYYARIVRGHAIMRNLDEVHTRGLQRVRERTGEPAELADMSAAEILGITEGRDGEECVPAAEILPATLDEIEAISKHGERTGVPTGFADLDELTNGLHAGQFLVVAGRPALGKSTLGMDFARAASIKNGLATVIFSLEMGREELMMRMLSAEARVPLTSIRTGGLSDGHWARLAEASGRIAKAPLFVDDSPNITIAAARAKCRRLKHRHDLKLSIFDYLQLMSSPRRTENRQVEVADLSRSLKLLAKELDIPVVAMSQLNRGPEQRQDKKPLLSDLRESGAIEQDTDVVILLHREDAYEKESPRAGEADLIVAKHRNGPTATVTVCFQGHYSRFTDMATTPEESRPQSTAPRSSSRKPAQPAPTVPDGGYWSPSGQAEDA
jgi:replicative DNA helicase